MREPLFRLKIATLLKMKVIPLGKSWCEKEGVGGMGVRDKERSNQSISIDNEGNSPWEELV